MLRTLRQWIVARATDAALALAPHLPPTRIDRFAHLLAMAGGRLPILARQVAGNMRSAGVYSPSNHRAYFGQLGRHFAGALHAMRAAGRDAHRAIAQLRALADARVSLDSTVLSLRDAPRDAGLILVGPHINGYLLNLTCLNQALPLTVYLRYSPDARRRAAKERWYEASGVSWISEPADAGGTLGRLGRMADALRAGRTLFITPDLPQRPENGVAVRVFDREIYLPAGFAWLWLRTGAPVFMLTAAPCGTGQVLRTEGPFMHETRGARGRGARRDAVAACMQWFASRFEVFVRANPALWYLWGDKRWTRVFRGDPAYTRLSPTSRDSDAPMEDR